jgi:ABC-type multidrug transport system ATPase subunit
VLAVVDLGRKFGRRWVLRHVEFDLNPGEVLMVRGRNGSGKSTLLRLLAGLLSPSEGSVVRPAGPLRSTIGYAALDLALYPGLTAREHLKFAATMRQIENDGDALLERVGLADSADRLVGQYSSGMRARLKLALALQTSPAALLLDEPTASLDDEGRRVVEDIIDRQRQAGVVVVATNEPDDVRQATGVLQLG